jgi:integrase
MATSRKPITKLSNTVFPYRGKYRVQYFDSQGKIRTKTAATLKDAYKELALLEQQVSRGTHPIRGADLPTISEWLDSWYESRRNEVSPTTLWNFETTIRLHIKPALGELRLDKLTAAQVERHYKVLQETKSLSQGSIYKVHATLRHAFGAAVRGGLLHQTPMSGVKAPKQIKKPLETLTFEEVQLLSLRLGLRQGECLALTWADIDLERSSSRVKDGQHCSW